MKFKFDPTADALYIYLNNKKVSYTRETGDLNIDYSDDNNIIGFEVLDAHKFMSKDKKSILVTHI